MFTFVLTGFEASGAGESTLPPALGGFVVLYDTESVPVMLAHAPGLAVIYLDTAVITPDGTLEDSAPAALLGTLVLRRLPTELTVSNLVSPRASVDTRLIVAILHSRGREESLIRALAAAAAEPPFDGINVDFEGVPRRDGPALTRFIGALASALHGEHRLLSIDVPALTRRDARKSAFSYRGLGRRVDAMLIMAYDYSYPGSRPGPIAPVWWVRRVLSYAAATIPAPKIRLGIPFYGYDWAGRDAAGLTLGQVQALITSHHARIHWNARGEAPYFLYTLHHHRHIVYYMDRKSLRLVLAAARQAGIDGLFYWFVGSGRQALWDLAATYHN
ncbi:MAG: glycosyl hydrolase family 18 protein [Clostridia bacterium]